MGRPLLKPYLLVTLLLLGAGLGLALGLSEAPHTISSTRPVTSPFPETPAAVPDCQIPQLALISDPAGWHGNESASNQFRDTLTFTNVSSTSCELSGWPHVQAVIGGIAQPTLNQRVRQSAPPAPASSPIALNPRSTASFNVYGEDFDVVNQRTCPETSDLIVAPPSGLGELTVVAELPDCRNSYYVSPLIPGSIDKLAWGQEVSSS